MDLSLHCVAPRYLQSAASRLYVALPRSHCRTPALQMDTDSKPKGWISWVPVQGAVKSEVRLYDHLFTDPYPSDAWESQLNSQSEVSEVIGPSPPGLAWADRLPPFTCRLWRQRLWWMAESLGP
jgi:hypothetical protein